MTCTPNPITTPILLAIALFAYCWRHRNDPPFREQWYRGCGRNPPTDRTSENPRG